MLQLDVSLGAGQQNDPLDHQCHGPLNQLEPRPLKSKGRNSVHHGSAQRQGIMEEKVGQLCLNFWHYPALNTHLFLLKITRFATLGFGVVSEALKDSSSHYVQTSTEHEKESQFRALAIHQSILKKKGSCNTSIWRCLRVSNNRFVRLSPRSTKGPPLLGSSAEPPTWLLHCYMSGFGNLGNVCLLSQI